MDSSSRKLILSNIIVFRTIQALFIKMISFIYQQALYIYLNESFSSYYIVLKQSLPVKKFFIYSIFITIQNAKLNK